MTTTEKQDCFVSVVAVLQDSRDVVEPFLREVQAQLGRSFTDYEIVLIDQHSLDGTVERVEALMREVPSVRLIELSARMQTGIAYAAGIENAIGDFVVIMMPGEDPASCIPEVVRRCREGADVVVGVAPKYPQSLPYRIFRRAFERVRRMVGYDVPWNSTMLRCLSRRAVNAVTRTGRFHLHFFYRLVRTGYPCALHPYAPDRSRLLRRTFYRTLRETIRMLVFSSPRPLRWMSALGFLGSLVAVFIAAYSLVIRLFRQHVVEGWTTLVLFMSLLFMLLFTILAFFGEYLGRLLDERSEQSDYSVVYEKHSSVMLDENRYNVLRDATRKDVNIVQTGRDR